MLIGGIGELLLTVGVLLLLFVAWQLWWTNIEAEGVQKNAITSLTQEWEGAKEKPGKEGPTLPLEGSTWGVLYVPRFGDAYAKPVAEGVEMSILDTVGIGRYPDTQMPGEKGNVALAGHRQTHGQVFWDVDKLKDGDLAYLQTAEGIYTYTFSSRSIVAPSRSDVILPVPGQPGEKPAESLLTLTTCHPPFSTAERMIVHFTQTDFTPAAQGAPAAIAELVEKTTGR